MGIVRLCWMLFVTSCGFPHGVLGQKAGDASDAPPGMTEDAPDGDAPQITPADGPSPDTIGMGTWTNIAAVLPGAPAGDDDPTLTADLLEMYFNRNADIYVSKRASVTAAWGTPTLVTEVSSPSNETTPEITSDGLVMYLASDRSPTTGSGDDIFLSTRASRNVAWSTPVHVNELSSGTDNAASAPTDDLLVIVQIGDPTGNDVNLYFSNRASATGTWATPQLIGNVNSTSSDFSPMMSHDHLTLYFDSTRNNNNEDLYQATRASTSVNFGTPTMISELSTNAQETDPWVSPDGHHMFFVRDTVLYEASR